MRPLAEFPAPARRRIASVLCDIDDTITSNGRLTAAAYTAMESLKHAGLRVVPVTGRPAGWCDHIARMWPVDAVVGENGAFWFRYDHATRKMHRRYAQDDATRAANHQRLAAIGKNIVAAVPGCAIAADQRYREADLAIDFCEDVPRLAGSAVARIVSMMQEAGLTAKVSSIHVNGWFGAYDKLGMTKMLFAECFGLNLDDRNEQIAFIGDSPNDAPMFGFFRNSVGVANIKQFADAIVARPAYVTRATSGAGFCEFAEAMLAAR
jgi:HAD superfamily hydrolase (TIGR01484 family)